MKSVEVAVLFVFINALLCISANAGSAAQAKHIPSQRAGQTAQQMSSKGSAQRNHQWSADPERGWVRGDEVDGANERRSATKRGNQSKHRSNDKGKKF